MEDERLTRSVSRIRNVPRACLVVPLIVGAAAWTYAFLFLPPRSRLILLVGLISELCGLVAFVAVILAITRLLRFGELRTSANIACTALGAIPAGLFLVLYWKSLY